MRFQSTLSCAVPACDQKMAGFESEELATTTSAEERRVAYRSIAALIAAAGWVSAEFGEWFCPTHAPEIFGESPKSEGIRGDPGESP